MLRILRSVRPLRAALAVTALLSVGGLAGPISEALATFTSKPTVSMPQQNRQCFGSESAKN